MTELYKLLNIPRTASLNEIKAAYRVLAKELHPDVNKGSAGKTARFRDIASAYEILSDVAQRNKYDRTLGSLGENKGKVGKYTPPKSPFVYAPPSSSSTAAERAYAAAAEEKYRRDFEASGGKIKFNVEEWHAWHYGDQAIIDALKMRSLRMGLKANSNEQIFRSKRTQRLEEERRKQAFKEAENEAAAVLQSMKNARENLKQRRDARRKETNDGPSSGMCSMS